MSEHIRTAEPEDIGPIGIEDWDTSESDEVPSPTLAAKEPEDPTLAKRVVEDRKSGRTRVAREKIKNILVRTPSEAPKESPAVETHRPATEEVAQTIVSTAEAHEIELGPERLKRLTEIIEAKATGDDWEEEFEDNGIIIQKARAGSARIDFLPPSIREGLSSASTPQRQEMTRTMLIAVRGMTDYCLLVEAGYIEQPPKFDGLTNPTMATIARRLGFVAGEPVFDQESPGGKKIPVSADFADVRERVFSDETRRYEALLARRAANS